MTTTRTLNADGIWIPEDGEVARSPSAHYAADPGKQECVTGDIVERLHERTTLRYMADCKCGKCQCVPLDLIGDAANRLDLLRKALERARTILGNMAKENPEAIGFRWQRWPISHEPLRADAKNLLPTIDAILAEQSSQEVSP